MIGEVLALVALTAVGLKLHEKLGEDAKPGPVTTPASTATATPETSVGASPLLLSAPTEAAGPLLRMRVRVPRAHVEAVRQAYGAQGQKAALADVERRVEGLGYCRTEAVLQDPTDPERFTVLARKRSSQETKKSDGVAEVVSAEVVDEVPQGALYLGAKGAAEFLDPGLTSEELATIRTALASDENPRHLGGLASTFEPWFPVAASLLRAKAALLETRDGRNAQRLAASNLRAAQHVVTTVEKNEPGEGKKVLAWMRRGAPGEPPTLLALSRPTRGAWPEVDMVWRNLARWSPASWYGLDRMRAALRAARKDEGARPEDKPKSDAELRQAIEAHSKESGIPLNIVRDEIRRAACLCCEEPVNLMADEPQLPVRRVQMRQFPPCVQEAARRLVREVGLGVWIVDEDAVRRLLSPDGEQQSYVSPSALQLVLASQKPEYSGVGERDVARQRIKELQEGTGGSKAEVLKAQAQMERALRAIERRRWMDWYRTLAATSRAG